MVKKTRHDKETKSCKQNKKKMRTIVENDDYYYHGRIRMTIITATTFYLFGPKEGERGFNPRGPFPPPKIKFGDDVLEEMKNGISVSVVAYTEIDNGGNFTVLLTGFGGLDFAE